MILSDEEIMTINQTAEFDSAIGYARAVESAVLDKLKAQEPACWVLYDQLKQRESIYNGRMWFSNPVNSAWVPLYTNPIPADDVVRDAARYRFLRDEAYLVNPVVAVVWKKNDDREESEWVNTVDGYSLDYHIDKAMGETK